MCTPRSDYALRCLRAGAAGYLTKDSAPENVIDAIGRVTRGKRYISDEVAEQLAARRGRRRRGAAARAPLRPRARSLPPLIAAVTR